MRRILIGVLLAAVVGVSCRRAPVPTPEVVALVAEAVPADPADPAWRQAPEHLAKLLLQDLVEPRLMTPSTPEVRVRALSNRSEIGFRLEWVDPTRDDLPGAGRFVDGCAVQVPEKADPNAPDPQMGQPGKGVQIAYWRADWQATVDGRGTSITDLYPNAAVDHYPFQAPSLQAGSDAQQQMARRYAPAEAVGNQRAGPRRSPVEDLVAQGPGTLAGAPSTISRGKGVRTKDGWAVVIVRAQPEGLSLRTPTQVAFAVWEGTAKEAGSRKMRTGWIGLTMREAR